MKEVDDGRLDRVRVVGGADRGRDDPVVGTALLRDHVDHEVLGTLDAALGLGYHVRDLFYRVGGAAPLKIWAVASRAGAGGGVGFGFGLGIEASCVSIASTVAGAFRKSERTSTLRFHDARAGASLDEEASSRLTPEKASTASWGLNEVPFAIACRRSARDPRQRRA